MSKFVAIDFETASHSRDSACSIGIVVVASGKILAKEHYLIRPPSTDFVFTHIHGLQWSDVKNAPRFKDIWPRVSGHFQNVDFLAAHNANFDCNVLSACCESGDVTPPSTPFLCTMKLARSKWNIYPTKLPDVCRKLGISLEHHQALSDANACAQIILAAERQGWRFPR